MSTDSSKSSRIPNDLVDQPTQRLYFTTLFLFIQSRKILDLFRSLHSQDATLLPLPLSLPLNDSLTNWLKWSSIDFAFLSLVMYLRIERLEWNRNHLILLFLLFGVTNYGLFGDWKFASFIFLPTSLTASFARHLATGEISVRVASVLGNRDDFLSGRVDVHVLALSTAHLNPLLEHHCIPRQQLEIGSKSTQPVFIPIFFNNTIPSKIIYNLTSITSPYTTTSHTVLAKDLKKHSSTSPFSSSSTAGSNSSNEWSLVLHNPSHSHSGSASTLSVYYLPIGKPGIIHLHEVLDEEFRTIKIKRSRSTSTPTSPSFNSNNQDFNQWEGIRISSCPFAGFKSTESTPRVINKCLGGVTTTSKLDSIDLELRVIGEEPLEVTWHRLDLSSRSHSHRRGSEEVLAGIKRGKLAEGEVINVPWEVGVVEKGRFKWFVDSVKDRYGNKVEFDHDDLSSSSSTASKKKIFSSSSSSDSSLLNNLVDFKEVIIHSPPQISFVGKCGRGQSVKLSRGKGNQQKERASLEIKLKDFNDEFTDGTEGEWKVGVRFIPEITRRGERREIIFASSREEVLRFEVGEPGVYELVEVEGKFCKGIVLSPSECNVYSAPIPTLQATFTPILDSCKAEIGTSIDLILTGSPPFTITYTQQRLSSPQSNYNDEGRITTKSIKTSHSRISFEIKLEPGEWEYKIISLEDSNYGRIDLPYSNTDSNEKLRMKQTLPMVGGARFKDSNERVRKVFSCQGDVVDVDVVLKGQPPYTLEYTIVGSPSRFLSSLTSSTQTLHIPIPDALSQKGGEFFISLRSLKDGNGCTRKVEGEDLKIEVKRNRPSASVVAIGEGGLGVLKIREREDVKIPLRLTGEGPWSVEYRSPEDLLHRSTLHKIEATQANFDLPLSNPVPGTYKLLSVKDVHCPGDLMDTEWKVEYLPRPTLRLEKALGVVRRDGKVLRKGICQGGVDKVGISFEGKSPFIATYSISNGGKHFSKDQIRTLQSIQPEAELVLSTDHPGRYIYTINGVSDTLYSSSDDRGLNLLHGGQQEIRFEQDVFPIPSAAFRQSQKSKSTFCVNDKLTSRLKDDLVINLDGQPPFELELEVRRDDHFKRFIIPGIKKHSYSVDLPFSFSTPSPYTLSIIRVQDSNKCEYSIESLSATSNSDQHLQQSILLNVAQTATIIPLSTQIDHCVGDFLEFGLQGGPPPFTVTYEFNKKQFSVPITSTNKFSRLATTPGRFEIISVGHSENQCKSSAEIENNLGLVKIVHAIPAVKVDDGNLVIVDLREGEQTEIVFTLTGIPPFTFTYQRQLPQDRSKDKTILETRTISGVMEHSYSIFSSQEGTWTVSFIQDKYCAYPPRQTPSIEMITSS